MINVFQPCLGEEEVSRIREVFQSNWLGKGKLVEPYLQCLCREVEQRWGVHCHPGHMSKLVRGLGLSRQKARPAHPKVDLEAQAAFAKRGSAMRWRPSARRIRASA